MRAHNGVRPHFTFRRLPATCPWWGRTKRGLFAAFAVICCKPWKKRRENERDTEREREREKRSVSGTNEPDRVLCTRLRLSAARVLSSSFRVPPAGLLWAGTSIVTSSSREDLARSLDGLNDSLLQTSCCRFLRVSACDARRFGASSTRSKVSQVKFCACGGRSRPCHPTAKCEARGRRFFARRQHDSVALEA
eukprot:scaffold8346_cov267-Pinguiococcus_pyrenoidosus.AAC.2